MICDAKVEALVLFFILLEPVQSRKQMPNEVVAIYIVGREIGRLMGGGRRGMIDGAPPCGVKKPRDGHALIIIRVNMRAYFLSLPIFLYESDLLFVYLQNGLFFSTDFSFKVVSVFCVSHLRYFD